MPESSRSTDAPLSRALGLAREALAESPAGLLTDFDGTLSPIVSDPALARLVEGAEGPLAELSRRLAVVAIVTGRAPLDARRMVGVPGILVAGNHGTEWLEPDADEPTTSPDLAAIQGRLDGLLARIPRLPGVVQEPKGISASVHYRGAPDPGAARAAILDALGDAVAHGIELRHGRMIVELRPTGLGDKGSATRAIIERFGLRGAVVMGDDLTDLDMFAAVTEARRAGRLRGVVVAVGGADHEAPDAVIEAADVTLADPAEAAVFLAKLVRS
ncbi:MAG TPA: trehalose-phosphatase [Candidatus Limnocylindria bacterium]|nr:trehalose-phosphatase [Candidatus Limnocylindria bacterium]